MLTEDCDIVWAAEDEVEHILDSFKWQLKQNKPVWAAQQRIYTRLYDGQGWSQADCDLVGEWLDNMQSGYYTYEIFDENGDTIEQGDWIAVDARDYKAQLVGKEVALYV